MRSGAQRADYYVRPKRNIEGSAPPGTCRCGARLSRYRCWIGPGPDDYEQECGSCQRGGGMGRTKVATLDHRRRQLCRRLEALGFEFERMDQGTIRTRHPRAGTILIHQTPRSWEQQERQIMQRARRKLAAIGIHPAEEATSMAAPRKVAPIDRKQLRALIREALEQQGPQDVRGLWRHVAGRIDGADPEGKIPNFVPVALYEMVHNGSLSRSGLKGSYVYSLPNGRLAEAAIGAAGIDPDSEQGRSLQEAIREPATVVPAGEPIDVPVIDRRTGEPLPPAPEVCGYEWAIDPESISSCILPYGHDGMHRSAEGQLMTTLPVIEPEPEPAVMDGERRLEPWEEELLAAARRRQQALTEEQEAARALIGESLDQAVQSLERACEALRAAKELIQR